MTPLVRTGFLTQHADLDTAVHILDKWIEDRMQYEHLPGLAAGIVHEGRLIWGRGYGLASVARAVPVTLDTRFRIASITKTFTAVAILQLRDAGSLRLDDPVSSYLNWFNLRYQGAPPITLRHLLTHTSGLPRDATVPHWTEDVFQSWDELVATTQQRQPVLPPHQQFGYSNLGYSLLGGIVETVSGESWAAYVQRHILDPLGMAATLVTPDGSEPDLATGYFTVGVPRALQPAPFVATNGFSPSASMASSVRGTAPTCPACHAQGLALPNPYIVRVLIGLSISHSRRELLPR